MQRVRPAETVHEPHLQQIPGLGAETAPTLTEAGRRIAAAVRSAGPSGGLPAFVRAFPARDLVARSERYIKKNFMGYEFLHDGYVAAYRTGGKDLEGFFAAAASEVEASDLLAKLLAALKAEGQTVEKAGAGFHARNRYGQHLFIGRVGAALCGAMRVPEGLEAAGRSLFETLAAALPSSK